MLYRYIGERRKDLEHDQKAGGKTSSHLPPRCIKNAKNNPACKNYKLKREIINLHEKHQ